MRLSGEEVTDSATAPDLVLKESDMLRRLYIIISLLLLAGFIAASAVAFSSLSDFNRKTTEKDLSDSIRLVAERLSDGYSYEELDKYISGTIDPDSEMIRITIITLEGVVVFDSETDAAVMDNHLSRPEIAEALRTGNQGVSIRKSDTLDIDTFYLVRPDPDSGLLIRSSMPMKIYESSVDALRGKIILLLAVLAGALIIMGLVSARLIASPVVRLKAAADQMAAGNYSVRLPVKNSDRTETGEMGRSFNLMAEELEKAHRQLKDDNLRMDMILNAIENPIVSVDDDLIVTFMNSETKREFVQHDFPENENFPLLSVVRSPEAEGLVRRALSEQRSISEKIGILTSTGKKVFRVSVFNADSIRGKTAIVLFQDISQAEKLSQMRTDFVASVTHELKTPLTSIRGFVDTLRNNGVDDPAVRRKFLDIIDVEAERLHNLISDILSLSEIEEMRSDTDTGEFDLYELIDEVIVLLDDEASQRHVALITGQSDSNDTGPDRMIICANRGRIKQILINLIENAIRYNVIDGKVFIEASRSDDDELIIRVSDTGTGISREHLPRIFERFYRVDKGRSRELGGTGLGLSIVKHIAMLYKGSVSALSTPGEGTVISVRLKV